MKKIEIKLKKCCLDCEHFDPSGCTGLYPSVSCCGEPDRVIACGHMEVCKKYLESIPEKKMWKKSYLPNFGMQTIYVCPECGLKCAEKHRRCPACGIRFSDEEEKA